MCCFPACVNWKGVNDVIDWKRKLTSRKWWTAVATFVVATILMFKGDKTTAETVGAWVMYFGVVVGYTIGEGLADAAGAPQIRIDAEP